MDPLAEIEELIRELEAQAKTATAELISYRATEKQLAADAEALEHSSARWEQRARAALSAGDEALARAALVEKHHADTAKVRLAADRREAAHYAAGLLRSRREFMTKLEGLKARRHTLAAQVAAARSGGANPLSAEGAPFQTFDRLEDRILEETTLAELDEMLGSQGDEAEERRLQERMKKTEVDAALAELKKRAGS